MKRPPAPSPPATTTSKSLPCATSPAAGRPLSRPSLMAPPATVPRSASTASSIFRPTQPLWPPAPSKTPPLDPQNVDITVFVSGLNPADILRYNWGGHRPPLLPILCFATYGIDHPQRRTQENRSRQLLRRQ